LPWLGTRHYYNQSSLIDTDLGYLFAVYVNDIYGDIEIFVIYGSCTQRYLGRRLFKIWLFSHQMNQIDINTKTRQARLRSQFWGFLFLD